MKNRNMLLTMILAIPSCFTVAPLARAVVPAPDGGYPGSNTAEGQNALFSLTTGLWNTALGAFTLSSDTTGNGNTAVGINVLRNNVTGAFNTGVGLNALFTNNGDPSVGAASQNSAFGTYALFHNTTGYNNCAFGAYALFSNNNGGYNTAFGSTALLSNTTGIYNTAIGVAALYNNTGSYNTAIGNYALFGNNSGANNTAIGTSALFVNNNGANNTAIGTNALVNNGSGSNNIAVGFGAGSNVHTASDTICIGAAGVDVTDGCYIGHVFEEPLDPDNLAMAIDVNGKVGTLASSRRFKDNIKPMDKSSEAILALKPVTFHYKNDAKRSPRFGLIAEEVAKVDPNLVARDKEGKPYSVRYDQVNAMLLNEFLKEHKKVEEQGVIITKQQKQIEALTEGLQKVSDQLQLSKPAPQLVLSNP
jgi:hypothetical protein